MSEFTDKVSGIANEVGGKIKQAAGDVTGNDKTKAEGAAQETKGDIEKGVGNVKGDVKSVVNDL